MDGIEEDWSKLSLAKEETSIRPAGLRVVGEILEMLLQPSSTTPCMVPQSRALQSASILFLIHTSATSFLTAPTHKLQILYCFFSKLHHKKKKKSLLLMPCTYSFPNIISFNPYSTHMRKVLLFIFYRRGDGGSRSHNYSSRVSN